MPSGEVEPRDLGHFVIRKHNSTELILSIVSQQTISELILCQDGVGSWTVDTRDFGGFKTVSQVRVSWCHTRRCCCFRTVVARVPFLLLDNLHGRRN